MNEEKKNGKKDNREKIDVFGVEKSRWRCPECNRAFIYGHCVVHGELEPVDLKELSRQKKLDAIMYSVYAILEDIEDSHITKEKLHNKIGLDKEIYQELIESNLDEVKLYEKNGDFKFDRK